MHKTNLKTAPLRPFRTGERVFDDADNRWGTIIDIRGFKEKDKDVLLGEDNVILLTDGTSEWEQWVSRIYKTVPGKTFQGFPICYEHQETEDRYDYYCPDLQQNCWETEITLNI